MEHVHAQQEADTTGPPRGRLHDIFTQAMNSIRRDTSTDKPGIFTKSEDVFKRYEGRYIRSITISQMGFEKRLVDTSRYFKTLGTKIYNALHVNTKDWVIKNNLFIREGMQVNSYQIADNERFLRNIDFIQDARILLKPVKGHPDSVDVVVITKDLFSITGDLDASSLTEFDGDIADANFLGMGQRLQFAAIYNDLRLPRFGYEILYKKNNLFGSFIDATIAYSQINTGRSEGGEDEEAYLLRLYRPLISPYSHFAGGLEISKNSSVNFFKKPDTAFYLYGYNTFDAWFGYNMGSYKLAGVVDRDRKFISIRYLNNRFDKLPEQVGDTFDAVYNSKEGILGQVTFFRQEFYKTNYIYGFGTTEDMPHGYNLSVVGGWGRQRDLERPYAGIDFNKYIASGAGEFYQVFLKAGGFYKKKQFQDAGLQLGASVFSRLVESGSLKYRQYFRFTYTQMFNRITSGLLLINNKMGLPTFSTGEVNGTLRMSAYAESILFTNFRVLGFRFAPYVFGDGVLIKPEGLLFSKSDIYTGLGGGLRVRNENLVFGTVQTWVTWFPRTVGNVQGFKVDMASGIQFRYRSNYVVAPDILQLNSDEGLY